MFFHDSMIVPVTSDDTDKVLYYFDLVRKTLAITIVRL